MEASQVEIAGKSTAKPAEPAKPERMEYEGRDYWAMPLTAGEFVTGVEERLRATRLDPMAAAMPQLKALEGMPHLQAKLLEMAWADVKAQQAEFGITLEDIMRFMQTRPGLTYITFLALRKGHPDMTEELATKIVLNRRVEQLEATAVALNADVLRAAAAKQAIDLAGVSP